MENQEPIWSITEVNSAVRELVENSLLPFWLHGEVGTLVIHRSGHVYLTFKDQNSQLRGTFFNGAKEAHALNLCVGMQVEAYGKLTVYAARGDYQFNIKKLRSVGAGDLQMQFEAVKTKLAAEGLFDASRKRTFPALVRQIGLITAADGAAARDFIQIARRRFPGISILLYPAVVQGNATARSVIGGLHFFERIRATHPVDAIVLARGGGSMEDLWGFNEESLARAIAASPIPVVSAIGHEIDFTIADFVADLRAPTPSAAAELLIPERRALEETLTRDVTTLERSLRLRLSQASERLLHLEQHQVFQSGKQMLQGKVQQLDEMTTALEHAWERLFQGKSNRLQIAETHLKALDPGNVLRRGYALVRRAEDGALVHSTTEVPEACPIKITLSDGEITAQRLSEK